MPYYDANVLWDGETPQQLSKVVDLLTRLGYDGVVYNYIFPGKLSTSIACPIKIPVIESTGPTASTALRLQSHKSAPFQQFTRITLILQDMLELVALVRILTLICPILGYSEEVRFKFMSLTFSFLCSSATDCCFHCPSSL